MWHVSFRSGVATLRTAIHLLLTYLLWAFSVPQPSVLDIGSYVCLLLLSFPWLLHKSQQICCRCWVFIVFFHSNVETLLAFMMQCNLCVARFLWCVCCLNYVCVMWFTRIECICCLRVSWWWWCWIAIIYLYLSRSVINSCAHLFITWSLYLCHVADFKPNARK